MAGAADLRLIARYFGRSAKHITTEASLADGIKMLKEVAGMRTAVTAGAETVVKQDASFMSETPYLRVAATRSTIADFKQVLKR